MSSKKSSAKRIGIKSVFAHDNDHLTITTFGKGNKADIVLNSSEKGRAKPCPVKTKLFTVNDIGELIGVEQGKIELLLNNPTEMAGEDYLQLKGELEKYFFGKEYPNDTVRIQIIHNILDILKIFGMYVNDIIYTVNNLSDEPEDIIGLGKEKQKEALFKMKNFFSFFGEAFRVPVCKRNKKGEVIPDTVSENHNFSVLQILGDLRQWSAHFDDASFFFSKYDSIQKKMIENASPAGKGTKDTAKWKIIDESYEKRINEINQDFLDHSKMNLNIIFDLLNVSQYYEEQAEIIQEYYRFSILKEGKNLGVNMTKLRECMINQYYKFIKDKKYDSFRKKIYTILDYLIFKYLRNTEELDEMVSKLRITSDEKAKDALYLDFAQQTYELLEKIISSFIKSFDNGFPVFSTEMTGDLSMLGKVAFGRGEKLPFVQMISFLCNFLEGKEINELLTAYIHKFENIQSFIDTLKEMGDQVKFSDKYKSFNNFGDKLAQRIASQLRVLASIGKMKPDMEGAKRNLYKAAIVTLGIPDDSEYISNEWLEENVLLDQSDKELYKKKKSKINPFRNFIAGNVISSRRFMYLVRYTKPKTVRALMQNPAVVHYVLTRLPEAQIDSYCGNIGQKVDGSQSMDLKYDFLTEKLSTLSFVSVYSQRNGIVENTQKNTRNKNMEIERLKALIALYLTVAYVAIKNLVKANARYYIAFSAFERDYFMLKQKHGNEFTKFDLKFQFNTDKGSREGTCEYFSPLKFYLAREDQNDYKPLPGEPFDKEACRRHLDSIRRHFTKKWRDIFRQQIEEAESVSATGLLLTYVRNEAAHLNVMTSLSEYVGDFLKGNKRKMRSYFELYHFILQKRMFDVSTHDELTFPDKWRKIVETIGEPCLDLIKVAYVSLGYNLARYKNLTIEALFDKDSETGKAMEEKQQTKEKRR